MSTRVACSARYVEKEGESKQIGRLGGPEWPAAQGMCQKGEEREETKWPPRCT